MLQIGDKVRFLNAVGGGVVKRFKGKDVVLVEEEDGFETPVSIRECIVVGGEKERNSNHREHKGHGESVVEKVKEEKKEEIVEITERPGGDRLNVYLAYLPLDIKNIG
ncbi:MAG: DUF2027 domain-containing protein, partial [Dysgonamonadaceae bacterium]|nr:DUF2027 domain-containing protein [Dysgonamonadaceae bacterium]